MKTTKSNVKKTNPNKPNFHPHSPPGRMSSRAQECEAKRSPGAPGFKQHREAIPNEKAANNCQQLSQNKPNLNKLLTKP
jgi:hypothetical protein